MPWMDEDGNISRGDGEYGKVGQQRSIYHGVVSLGFTQAPFAIGFPNTIQVNRLGQAAGTAFTIGLIGYDANNPPTSGSASLSWAGQSFTVNFGDDAATVQAALAGLSNVQSVTVGGQYVGFNSDGVAQSLFVNIWATPAHRVGVDMIVNSSSLTPTGAIGVASGFGLVGASDEVQVHDPTVDSVATGAYCIYAKVGRKLFVPLWIGC